MSALCADDIYVSMKGRGQQPNLLPQQILLPTSPQSIDRKQPPMWAAARPLLRQPVYLTAYAYRYALKQDVSNRWLSLSIPFSLKIIATFSRTVGLSRSKARIFSTAPAKSSSTVRLEPAQHNHNHHKFTATTIATTITTTTLLLVLTTATITTTTTTNYYYHYYY